jgi:hypothetical protein
MISCLRCKGVVREIREWDLPFAIREFFCLNCGIRFWVKFLMIHPN